MVPASEEGGLRSLEDYQFISWEELAANYTFIDDTPVQEVKKGGLK